MTPALEVWEKVSAIMGLELTKTAMDTWFDECTAIAIEDSCLYLCVPSSFKRGVIESRFMETLKSALKELFSSDFDVRLVDKEQAFLISAKAPSTAFTEEEEFTFERFVVGNSNKFAHAAAVAVSEGQHKNFNPLFIYGESGLGKTHLLYAIRHGVAKKHPDYNIVYVKGDDYKRAYLRFADR